jgi:hypothetical protein
MEAMVTNMENKKDNNNVEIFGEDSIITLYDDEDKPVEFFEVASVEYDGKFYEILQPVEPTEGIAEDEGVIFEYSAESGDGEKLFRPVFDEKLLENVFSLYIETLADYESCACGCADCGGNCETTENEKPADARQTGAKAGKDKKNGK